MSRTYRVPELQLGSVPDPWAALSRFSQAVKLADRRAVSSAEVLAACDRYDRPAPLPAERAAVIEGEARELADLLAAPMWNHEQPPAPVDQFRDLRVSKPRTDHVAMASYRWSRARMAWIPRMGTFGSRREVVERTGKRGTVKLVTYRPYRERLADRYVSAEVLVSHPFVRQSAALGERLHGLADARCTYGPGRSVTWCAGEEEMHQRAERAARREYIAAWSGVLDALTAVIRGPLGPIARPKVRRVRAPRLTVARTPVAGDSVSVRAAADACFNGAGRWHMTNGHTLARSDAGMVTLAVSEHPYAERPIAGAATADNLRRWVTRTLASWREANAQALAETAVSVTTDAAPDYALADVD